jgi:hypothetical protein
MNAQLRGGWGREERIPLSAGRGPYIATIEVTEAGFHVYEDGTLRHVFAHRDPWASFSRVEVGRECPQWPYWSVTVGGTSVLDSTSDRCWAIRVAADGSGSCDWLSERGDILFHFNPRYDDHTMRR